MLPLKYAAQEYENVELADYHINRITFGYARVMMPNEPDRCVMVPVWDFFGTYRNTRKDKSVVEWPEATQSLLTLNAVDGNVIDRDIGY